MAKAEGIPPTASVASVGLGINYVGDWVFGYSGIISVTNTETPLLEAVTGAGIIHAKVQPFYAQGSGGNNYLYRIYLNDEIVAAYAADGATDPALRGGNTKIILPPFTLFKFTTQNIASADPNDMAGILLGRVYDV